MPIKLDWAYRMAKSFLDIKNGAMRFGLRSNDPEDICALAALLRRAYGRAKRGY